MKNWYSTREGVNLQHKSQSIEHGKRIFLTDAQAKVHGDKLELSEAPKTAIEAGVKAEFDEWRTTQDAVSQNAQRRSIDPKTANAVS